MNTNMRQWFQILQPSFAKEFHLDAARMGLYSGILMIALSISGTGLAPWLDRGGHGWARKYRHLPIALCYLLFSILTGIGPLTTTFGALFAFQLVKNLASGIGETAEVTAVAEWWPVEQRGFAQGLHHTAFPWRSLLGGLAISAILSIFGDHAWRLVFLILPWILVPVLIIYWRFATPRNYAAFVDDTRARGLTPPLIETEDGSSLHATPDAFGRALRNPNIMVSSLVCGLCNFSYYGLGFWLPLYLSFVAHYPMARVAAYSVIFTITGGIGRIVWGLIADRLGKKYSLVAMCVWLAAAYILFRYIGVSVGVMIAIQLFIGMAINGVYPALYDISSDSTEKGAVAIANGLNMGGAALGGLSTIVVGYIIQAGGGYNSPTGFMVSLHVLSGVMVAAAVLMALFARETTGPFIHLDRALVSCAFCLRSGIGQSRPASTDRSLINVREADGFRKTSLGFGERLSV